MLYAQTGIGYNASGAGSNLLTHAQFANCLSVVCPATSAADVLARNLLVANCSNFLSGAYCTVRGEQITCAYASNLFLYPSSSFLYLTNTLLYSVLSTNRTGGANILNPASN